MKRIFALLIALLLPAQLWAAEPPVVIELGPRHGHATPHSEGCCHLAGGNTIVEQPSGDVLVVTMTGVAVASGHPFKDSNASMDFDLNQEFKVVINDAKLDKAKLTIEGRVVGLLRAEGDCFGQTGNCKSRKHKSCGSAEQGQACATVTAAGNSVASICVQPHSVCCGDALSVNCQEGPCAVTVLKGCYTLHQVFNVAAHHPKSVLPCKPASAEFAPDALDPLWISYWEPFHGASKKDFGFRVTIKVSAPD